MDLIKSLIILSLVSAFTGLCFYFLNFSFWPVFFLSCILQIFVFNLFTTWKKQKAIIELEFIENERIKEFNKIGIDSTCPDENCAHVTFIPIRLDKDIIYDCPKCNKKIKVYVGVKSFLTTTPITEDPFKKFNFVEGKDYDN